MGGQLECRETEEQPPGNGSNQGNFYDATLHTMEMEYVIGVDAGGTKTVAFLAEPLGEAGYQLVGKGAAGAANMAQHREETVGQVICAAIESAFASADMAPQPVSAACLAVAGAGRAPERLRLLRWASEAKIAEHVQVVHDAEPVLYSANPEGVGVALIAGTGSLAYGRDASGRDARCGGWGPLLGDEGSGYAIAVAGLRAAVRAADGRGPRTRLLAAFLEHLDCPAVSDLIAAIYDPSVTRTTIASLARIVLREAEDGDSVADAIAEASASDLAQMVGQVTRQLALEDGAYHLALTGGVLIHNVPFRHRVLAQLDAAQTRPLEVTPVPDPAEGAVTMACRHWHRVQRRR